MLFIHKVSDLTQKRAESESVYLLREVKQRYSLPLSPALAEKNFSSFYLSETDLQKMEQALEHIAPTQTLLRNSRTGHPRVQQINIERSLALLQTLPVPLENNIRYCRMLVDSQGKIVQQFIALLNELPSLPAEKKHTTNEELKALFQILLRCAEFQFNASDIIHEGPREQIHGLKESVREGFFYHRTIEEELKKTSPLHIALMIDDDHLVERLEQVEKNVALIQEGVERAYQCNMRIVEFSVILYTYLRWALGA